MTEHGKGGTQQLIKKRVHFFKPNGETEKKQTKLDDTSHHVTEMAKTKALVVWLLKSIDSGFSNNSSDDIVDCLKVMCPDSKIASSLKMKRTKAYYVINHGLAPYFKTLLLEDVSASDIFVLSFDESLNDVLQKCEMVIVIRWWSNADNKVKQGTSTYYGISILLQAKLIEVYHISMDGPSVNHKFLKLLKVDWQKLLVHKLIDIGSCNLHIISGAFKTGAQKTGWNIDKTLKGSYQIFHETPARREDYELVNSCDSYPKFFTATR